MVRLDSVTRLEFILPWPGPGPALARLGDVREEAAPGSRMGPGPGWDRLF